MGCAADLTRGPITDGTIRALGCLVDAQEALFSGTINAGVVTEIFSKDLQVTRLGVGVFSVDLGELLPVDAFGTPKMTADVNVYSGAVSLVKANVDTPVNAATTTFVFSVYAPVAVPTDPDYFTVTVHKG